MVISAEQSLVDGDLENTLVQLIEQIRNEPANPKLRIFLFQLSCVMGDWARAQTQLDVLKDMDASSLAMVQTYSEALRCEALRSEVFAGKHSPLIFGEPERWMALLFQALRLTAENKHVESQEVREQAFELAPATSGTIGGEGETSFEWIADADIRIGPLLEVIINGKYYWVPFNRIRTINIDPPADLRDMVWLPAYFTWSNGGETVGLIPTRYPGSEASEDSQIRLSHKTIWQQLDADIYLGLGQRLLTTDAGDYSLLDLREITFDVQSDDMAMAQSQDSSTVKEL